MRISFFAIIGAAALWLPTRAEAQFRYGYGLGLGYGYGGFNYRPSQVSYLNQRSLLNSSHATMGPVSWNAYANVPNAYYKHLHDPSYLVGFDVGLRREIEARIGRYSDGPPPSRTVRNRVPVSGGPRMIRDRPHATSVTPETAVASPRPPGREADRAVEPVVRPSPQSFPVRSSLPTDKQGRAGREN